MSTLSQFTGGTRVLKALINKTSTSGSFTDMVPASIATISGAKTSTSPALTAGALATVLSLTGAGSVSFAACAGVNNTARSHRFKLTVDGVVVYDATTLVAAGYNQGILLIGSLAGDSGDNFRPIFDPVPYNTSFLLEYASSLTESGQTNFFYVYRTY